MVSLRQYTGKQLVACVRGGDFAHAGEIEAIQTVMAPYPKKSDQVILDVGCGLGGTAHFMQQQGWGKVIGIDIEAQSIEYAKKQYADIQFVTSDVLAAPQVLGCNLCDIIVLFNAFYAFSDQVAALKVLAQLAKSTGKLAIFDYTDPLAMEVTTPLFRAGDEHETPFKPVKLIKIKTWLSDAGWQLTQQVDLSAHYLRWYTELVDKILQQEHLIKEKFGDAFFHAAYQTYVGLIDAIAQQQLGGAIFYAERG